MNEAAKRNISRGMKESYRRKREAAKAIVRLDTMAPRPDIVRTKRNGAIPLEARAMIAMELIRTVRMLMGEVK